MRDIYHKKAPQCLYSPFFLLFTFYKTREANISVYKLVRQYLCIFTAYKTIVTNIYNAEELGLLWVKVLYSFVIQDAGFYMWMFIIYRKGE